MARFNHGAAKARGTSPVAAGAVARGLTHEGAPGYARDARSELFLLAVSLMGDDTFYEAAGDRHARYTSLVRNVAVADPAWMNAFLPWLRDVAQMRTASVVAAAEAVYAMREHGLAGGRGLIGAALCRADEPGELIAYWLARYGTLPIALKRGVAGAVQRLYTEKAYLKWDSRAASVRWADVIELVSARYHGRAYGTWRDDLYRWAIEQRHGRDTSLPDSLRVLRANQELRARAADDPRALLDAGVLAAAGMTWEDVLPLAGAQVPKAELWSALIPVMGLMARLRNLRNFDQAGVSDEVANQVAAQLADPGAVRRSRQFPFRFLAAYRAAPSLRWAYPLEQALNYSLANIPALNGRTLILVDRSGSMFGRMSGRSNLTFADAAAVFGAGLALRCRDADLVQFGTGSEAVAFGPGESVLKVVNRFGYLGGTQTAEAVRRHYKGTPGS